ncbi:menaquinone biosynthesis family protein [Helicobacter trogontum]|uniref:1,4-dihydroxy-6-naphtoate synthase n=1 Tax=Helicobacter trogontum TaxID=50960 RepID=A0A4U8TGE3_9HELI|nr:MqnA/MqnD/SBP family protein [Helicobacter trogontum]MDY5185217.1 MqnA/MqnD/SBP family protein [Helicobacter trogontum]TLD99230.1 succinate--CoA ligase [Helicobacter trogontum]
MQTQTNLYLSNDAYTIAHSPDADDIFMYYAIAFGWVDTPYRLVNSALDIETLNVACLQGMYDISAISFSLYPLVCNEYALLRTGMSFGEGYGPKMVKRKNTSLKRNFKVALSGEHTTNAMLFRIYYPHARIVYKNFLDIEQSVLSGEVDAGVLIHESILNFSQELEVEAYIWDIWQELCKEDLPLPLGGMVLRRSIPLNRAIMLEEALTRAIQIGLRHQDILTKMLLENNLVRINAKELDIYLQLYANEHSHTLSIEQTRALEKLYEIGCNHKLYKQHMELEKYLIPTEYAKVRYS